MADDADAIYVDVVPRLDEAAADKAEEKLRDKFKDAAKDIGENIKGAFQNLEDHAKDFGENLKEHVKGAGETIGEVLRSDAARDIGRQAGQIVAEEVGGYLGQSLRDAIGGDTIDSAVDKVNKIRDTVTKLKSGDISGGLGGVRAVFGDVPGLDHAQSALDRYQKAHEQVKDTLSTAKEIAEILGPSAVSAVGALTAPAVTVPAAIGTAAGIWAGNKLAPPQTWGRFAIPGFNPAEEAGIPSVGVPATPDLILKGLYGPLGDPGTPTYPRRATSQQLFVPGSDPTAGVGSTGRANVQAQQAVVEASAATITAGSVSLGGLSLSSILGAGGGGWGGGTGGRPSVPSLLLPSSGGSSLGHSVGRASGGILPGSSPGHDNLLGNVGGTPIGLEGGEYVVNPQATQANLGLLQAINGGMMGFEGGGGPLAPILGGDTGGGNQKTAGPDVKGQSPGGVKGQSPGGVRASQPTGADLHASQPGQAPDQPSPPQTIIPQGEGQGFSLSGGIVGAAEGAASEAAGMAAGAFTFGGASGAASSATQILTQEANKAIETGVKAGITLGVEAPLDTFWLSDSGLSDPSHSWFGKLGLSMIGKTGGALQNLAGKTQAPLTPGQGDQDQSPLGGQGPKNASPAIHIENQYNGSDVDHANNNQTLLGNLHANMATSNSAYGY